MLAAVPGAAAAQGAKTATTRAQKLAKAVKACNKLPRSKRAACIKKAKKKYAPHHTTTTPTAPAAAPTGPAAAPPASSPSGPVAPAGPTVEWLQQELTMLNQTVPQEQILNVSILSRATPRLGSGLAFAQGGDEIPATTWVYLIQYRFDLVYLYEKLGAGYVWEKITETKHYTTEGQMQLDQLGQSVLKMPTSGGTSSCTSEPVEHLC